MENSTSGKLESVWADMIKAVGITNYNIAACTLTKEDIRSWPEDERASRSIQYQVWAKSLKTAALSLQDNVRVTFNKRNEVFANKVPSSEFVSSENVEFKLNKTSAYDFLTGNRFKVFESDQAAQDAGYCSAKTYSLLRMAIGESSKERPKWNGLNFGEINKYIQKCVVGVEYTIFSYMAGNEKVEHNMPSLCTVYGSKSPFNAWQIQLDRSGRLVKQGEDVLGIGEAVEVSDDDTKVTVMGSVEGVRPFDTFQHSLYTATGLLTYYIPGDNDNEGVYLVIGTTSLPDYIAYIKYNVQMSEAKKSAAKKSETKKSETKVEAVWNAPDRHRSSREPKMFDFVNMDTIALTMYLNEMASSNRITGSQLEEYSRDLINACKNMAIVRADLVHDSKVLARGKGDGNGNSNADDINENNYNMFQRKINSAEVNKWFGQVIRNAISGNLHTLLQFNGSMYKYVCKNKNDSSEYKEVYVNAGPVERKGEVWFAPVTTVNRYIKYNGLSDSLPEGNKYDHDVAGEAITNIGERNSPLCWYRSGCPYVLGYQTGLDALVKILSKIGIKCKKVIVAESGLNIPNYNMKFCVVMDDPDNFADQLLHPERGKLSDYIYYTDVKVSSETSIEQQTAKGNQEKPDKEKSKENHMEEDITKSHANQSENMTNESGERIDALNRSANTMIEKIRSFKTNYASVLPELASFELTLVPSDGENPDMDYLNKVSALTYSFADFCKRLGMEVSIIPCKSGHLSVEIPDEFPLQQYMGLVRSVYMQLSHRKRYADGFNRFADNFQSYFTSLKTPLFTLYPMLKPVTNGDDNNGFAQKTVADRTVLKDVFSIEVPWCDSVMWQLSKRPLTIETCVDAINALSKANGEEDVSENDFDLELGECLYNMRNGVLRVAYQAISNVAKYVNKVMLENAELTDEEQQDMLENAKLFVATLEKDNRLHGKSKEEPVEPMPKTDTETVEPEEPSVEKPVETPKPTPVQEPEQKPARRHANSLSDEDVDFMLDFN